VTAYHCGGPLSAAFRKLQTDADLRLLPVVGTAMVLDDLDADHTTSDHRSDTTPHSPPIAERSKGVVFGGGGAGGLRGLNHPPTPEVVPICLNTV